MSTGVVLSVNVGAAEPNPAKSADSTGIGKKPVDVPVTVRAPGPKGVGLHSGIVGDFIGDIKHHGGDDQAVYAYAEEDYAWWAAELGRELPHGLFGENLTTRGVDLRGAVVGERWLVGDVLVLQPTFGRIPCSTFQHRMGEPQWTKRFARVNRTGTYLRVLTPGQVRTGDRIEVVDRPAHGLTVAEAYRIWMHEQESIERLLVADELPAELREEVTRRLSR